MLVNEIFYSLQGEGYHAGTPAIFVRFSGCNLRCPFCDTQHEHGTEMSEEAIVAAARNLRPPPSDLLPNLVVLTGGEPALQLTPSLVELFHEEGCYMVAVETNGTLPLPPNVAWVTLSPKSLWLGEEAAPVLTRADELKVLFDGGHDPVNMHFHLWICVPKCGADTERFVCFIIIRIIHSTFHRYIIRAKSITVSIKRVIIKCPDTGADC